MLLSTNATLVCVLSYVKSFCIFLSGLPVTDISATVTPIGVKFCTMVHIGHGTIFSTFGGSKPNGSPKSQILNLNFGHLSANISETVSRSVTYQLHQLDQSFLKTSRGVRHKQNVLHVWAFLQYHLQSMRDHGRVTVPRMTDRVYLSDDGRSGYHTCGPRPPPAVIDRYFVHWTPPLTTAVRAQNDTSKTENISFSILHVERYTRPPAKSCKNRE